MNQLLSDLYKKINVAYEVIDPKFPAFKFNESSPQEGNGDAGYDLYYIGPNLVMEPGKVYMLETNIKVAVPNNIFGLLKDRSGMAATGTHVLAGVIDPGFRGQVKAIMVCFAEPIEITTGQRICQMIFSPYVTPMLTGTRITSDTGRGESGFGDSGTH